jgi:preprotein translocase subunit SecB
MPKKQRGTGSYEEFLRTVKPVVLGLKACQVELDRGAYWDLLERVKGNPERRLVVTCSVGKIKDDYFDLAASLTINVKDPASEREPLRIQCEFEVHFHGQDAVNPEHAKQFADAEAKLFIWPFFREFVSNTTARMTIPPLLIPMSFSLRPSAMPATKGRKASVAR